MDDMDLMTQVLRALSGDADAGCRIATMTVLHDDDCPKPDGGECSCEPEVEMTQWKDATIA